MRCCWRNAFNGKTFMAFKLPITFDCTFMQAGSLGICMYDEIGMLWGYDTTLQWRHNDYDGISDHHPHDYLLSRLFRRRSKKTSKLHVTGLCAKNSPVTGEFPGQRASYVENVSIWWHHHETVMNICHEYFITLNLFPHCWLFVRGGIQQWLVDSLECQ